MTDPSPTTLRTLRVFSDGNLAVWVHDRSDGSIDIEGQDLKADYEYHLTVRPDSLPKLAEALGGNASDDISALLLAQISRLLPRPGERAWLNEHKIPYAFHNWS